MARDCQVKPFTCHLSIRIVYCHIWLRVRAALCGMMRLVAPAIISIRHGLPTHLFALGGIRKMLHNAPDLQQNATPGKNSEIALILATGASVSAAAEKLGLARSTIHRKLRKPAFRKLVAELRSQLFNSALGRMAENMTHATDALASLLDTSDPGVKLRAAKAVLGLALRLRDSVDVSDRISELEAELARKQGVAP